VLLPNKLLQVTVNDQNYLDSPLFRVSIPSVHKEDYIMAAIKAGTNQPSTNGRNLRMNSSIRNTLGTFYKASQVTTAVYKDGGQVTSQEEADKLISSWYQARYDNLTDFERAHAVHLEQVVQEISSMEPITYASAGKDLETMIMSLNNKIARWALATAPICPPDFELVDDKGEKHQIKVKTEVTEVTGPNPLLPDEWNGTTCQYSNARNQGEMRSYWPKEVTDRLKTELIQMAGINFAFSDGAGNITMTPAEGFYPCVTAFGRIIIGYKQSATIQAVNNKNVVILDQVQAMLNAVKASKAKVTPIQGGTTGKASS
jgi:hypothetical protein